MKRLKNSKGITLIAIAITIVVLIIIAGVSINFGTDELKIAKSNSAKAQLTMVQHAILEKYTEYKVTKNEETLVGTKIEKTEAQNIADQIEVDLKATDNYYRLEKADLENLGITEEENTYIVNYETGEVMNETQMTTSLGDKLYTYATD